MCDEFLQDAVILQEVAQAFTDVLLKVKLKVFPHFMANMVALNHLLGPLNAPGTAAAAERAIEQWHRELMEEARRGKTYLADLLLK